MFFDPSTIREMLSFNTECMLRGQLGHPGYSGKAAERRPRNLWCATTAR
jgi:hypothetical protein